MAKEKSLIKKLKRENAILIKTLNGNADEYMKELLSLLKNKDMFIIINKNYFYVAHKKDIKRLTIDCPNIKRSSINNLFHFIISSVMQNSVNDFIEYCKMETKRNKK